MHANPSSEHTIEPKSGLGDVQRLFGLPTAIGVLFVSAVAARLALLMILGVSAPTTVAFHGTPVGPERITSIVAQFVGETTPWFGLSMLLLNVLTGALVVPLIYALVRILGAPGRFETAHFAGVAATVFAALWPAHIISVLQHDSASWAPLVVTLFAIGCVRLRRHGTIVAALLMGGSLAGAMFFLPVTLVLGLTVIGVVAGLGAERTLAARFIRIVIALVPVTMLAMRRGFDLPALPTWISHLRPGVISDQLVIGDVEWLTTLQVCGMALFAMAVLIGVGRARRREWATCVPVATIILLLIHVSDAASSAALQTIGFVFAGLTASLGFARHLVPVARPPIVEAFLGSRRENDGRETA